MSSLLKCPGGGMVDTRDLKFLGQKWPCKFESCPGYKKILMYWIPKKVMEIKKSLLEKVSGDLKNRSYRRIKKYHTGDSVRPTILNCRLFDYEHFQLLLGEIKYTQIGGSFIANIGPKPIIWMNTWEIEKTFPLMVHFQVKRFLKRREFVIDHEITHYIDHTFNRDTFNKESKKFRRIQDYYNCEIEINAYYCQVLNYSKNFWDFLEKLNKSYFITMINRKNKNRMLKRAYLYYNT